MRSHIIQKLKNVGRDEKVSLTSTMKRSVVYINHQRRPDWRFRAVNVDCRKTSVFIASGELFQTLICKHKFVFIYHFNYYSEVFFWSMSTRLRFSTAALRFSTGRRRSIENLSLVDGRPLTSTMSALSTSVFTEVFITPKMSGLYIKMITQKQVRFAPSFSLFLQNALSLPFSCKHVQTKIS